MSIVVTGATGHLGALVVESLLARGVVPGQIVATGRNESKLAAFADRGVRTETADFADPSSLTGVFSAGDVVLLVSGNEVGRRVAQHRNVIDAAAAAGVARIVYTSAPQADTSALILAPEHKATEELIRASGLPFTFLRNGWYHENYAATIEQARDSGVVLASVGAGRVASAARADFADAAAVVLTGSGHEGAIYELSGDTAWDYNELAATIGTVIGRDVVYKSVSPEEQSQILAGAGLDAGTVGFVVALDGNTRDGLLGQTSGDLSRLIGRPTTPLLDGLRAVAVQ